MLNLQKNIHKLLKIINSPVFDLLENITKYSINVTKKMYGTLLTPLLYQTVLLSRESGIDYFVKNFNRLQMPWKSYTKRRQDWYTKLALKVEIPAIWLVEKSTILALLKHWSQYRSLWRKRNVRFLHQ